ncbi:hypothetical protein PC9H_009498 [Pleurotus ostreatus]|uniref:Uncharacterized protein n=3 Tax=Pleurotus TaxID=5320 RepID=A0A067NLH0_PLEO1|nr:uncharacterized protein PC9H_009498 [Pleurotus ostreatus]KAF7424194.1 hypothetical protein PC9H_009498 [Pleurotus ostreatus]KAG9224656.1 hypothetical protein CCMSSC00406_0002193 [Pleurotus cornucopiae]KAJ8692948.1 hypothetical protein PTI98_010208 [Pleurotus ostreatus]KDQ24451.1 hypothetical protein PLEOSDRAFT_1090316 [Pleurotus ostreatus PC15]
MLSSTVVRRVAGARAAASRPLVQCAQPSLLGRRAYATPPKEETDPQLLGYPQLPFTSSQYLPAKGWQDSLMRRNYGDTLHDKDEILSMWGPDIPPIEPSRALFQFTLVALGFVTFGLIAKYNVPEMPSIRREYPFSGLVTELGGLEDNKARIEAIDDEE